MTEEKWLASPDSAWLLDWLLKERRPHPRKLRFFSLRCCVPVAHRLPEVHGERVLEQIERQADGTEDAARLDRERRELLRDMGSWTTQRNRPRWHACNAVLAASSVPREADALHRPATEYGNDRYRYLAGPYPKIVSEAAFYAHDPGDRAEALAGQVRALHELFGPLPFRDIVCEPAWLTDTVRALTRGVYDRADFGALPILADALQDAGCENEDVLNHCRAPECEHVRGCWVLDLLLGHPWREG
jgi:hypothetical protein